MTYCKQFFDLQVHFARAVATLSGLSLERTLLDYTNLYIRFGLGREFDPGHPTWVRYMRELRNPLDLGEWTYQFYLVQNESSPPSSYDTTFGCFTYSMDNDQIARIHFHNAEPTGVSPLRRNRMPFRMAELCCMFEEIERTRRQVTHVVGTSWLYNLPAYRRYFPDTYIASAQTATERFRKLSLWGQFLDRRGMIRSSAADAFLNKLSATTNAREVARAFPLQALAVNAPIADFWSFYKTALK